jgi:hypothetical protein
MKTKLSVATALAGTLLATCLVSGPARATSVPVLKSEPTPGIVTLVGKKGGGGSDDRKHYAYKDDKRHYYDYRSRYGWYGAPFFPYGGGCGWLYRNAKATRAPYWWNRYYECIGYY